MRALLAPARDDDQRVVDRHAQAEQGDQELNDGGDGRELGQAKQQQERGHDRDDRHENGDDRQEGREHEREHGQRAEPAEHGLEEQAGALAVGAAVLEERVEAGQVHRLPATVAPFSAALAAFSACGFSPKAEFGSGCG